MAISQRHVVGSAVNPVCSATPVAVLSLLLSLALAACGGAPADTASGASNAALVSARDNSSPRATGDTATDGLNWINFRRRQAGLKVLTRNVRLDTAALGQAKYLESNQSVTHVQTVGKPGFTGVTITDRLAASGYGFSQGGHEYGEVLAATQSNSGFNAADELVTAIYHRYVLLEPMSKQAGAAAAADSDSTYFAANVAADGLDQGLGMGKFITYPAPHQSLVPVLFHNDSEKPDPMPGHHTVGFPVSVHADLLSSLQVVHFTMKPHGGTAVPVQLLTSRSDANTPTSAAAIIPLEPLLADTTYDVHFVGLVDGLQVSRNWQFTTE